MARRNKEYFARWLDGTLTERGIAGGEIAKAIDVNDSAVSRWRNGKGSPGLDSIMKLAKTLEVDPIRLAVTAGLMAKKEVGVDQLPIPEPSRAIIKAKESIMKIPGITDEDRNTLVRTLAERYDHHES